MILEKLVLFSTSFATAIVVLLAIAVSVVAIVWFIVWEPPPPVSPVAWKMLARIMIVIAAFAGVVAVTTECSL